MTYIRFSDLHEDGTETNIKVIKHSDIMKCPSFILLPEHYRADGTCRHDETECERDNCIDIKYRDEIFCLDHLEELGYE